jgi:hypothetical protein
MTKNVQIPDSRIVWPPHYAPASSIVFAQNSISICAYSSLRASGKRNLKRRKPQAGERKKMSEAYVPQGVAREPDGGPDDDEPRCRMAVWAGPALEFP